jgi:hypothetical protein
MKSNYLSRRLATKLLALLLATTGAGVSVGGNLVLASHYDAQAADSKAPVMLARTPVGECVNKG